MYNSIFHSWGKKIEELEIMVYIQTMFYCLITFLGFTFKTLIYKKYIMWSSVLDECRNIVLGKIK